MTTSMDGGYARLAAALDESNQVTDHVVITVLGARGGTWPFFTGDHVQRDGSIRFGDQDGASRTVTPDSSLVEEGGSMLAWCGGHTMPDGARTERFNHAGTAMTVTWSPATQPTNEG